MKNLALRLDRIVVWVLLVGFIVFMLSGYAMTRGWTDYKTASLMHLTICPILVGLTFCYHSAFAIHLVMKRHRVWHRLGKAATGIYALAVAVGILALTHGAQAATPARKTVRDPVGSGQSGQVEANTSRFTKSQLAKYDGTQGNPAYVAINGIVYDVSQVYRRGVHFGCVAGRDITEEFGRVHPIRVLQGFPRVGTYVQG